MIEEFSGQFIKLKNFSFDNKLLEDQTLIILALSGGVDSIVLFYFLLWLKERNIYKDLIIVAAHLNHMIREEAKLDQAFVEELCRSFQVKCHVKKIDVIQLAEERQKGIEEAGRFARYEFFQELEKAYKADPNYRHYHVRIALGQHQDDLAESVIMNIGRGSGLAGITTLRAKENKIIRPLLDLSKAEIMQLAQEQDWQWVQDQTNLEDDYLRNRIRNNLIPTWTETIGYDIKPLLARLANNLQEDQQALAWMSRKAYQESSIKGNEFSLNKIRSLPKSIVKLLFEICLAENSYQEKKISHQQIEQIWQMIHGEHGNKEIDLGDGLSISRQKKRLIILIEE